MDIQHNKDIARAFYTRFTAGDIAGVLDTLADDATFWIAGQPGSHPTVGTRSKEEIARIFRAMLAQLKDGLRMTVKSAIAEGDRVALEVESCGELLNGRVYKQQYHALMTIRGKHIAAVREYMDTQHVAEIWYR